MYTGFDLSELGGKLAPHQKKLDELQLNDQNEARCAEDKSYLNDKAQNSQKSKDQTASCRRIEATIGRGFLKRSSSASSSASSYAEELATGHVGSSSSSAAESDAKGAHVGPTGE